MIQGRAKSFFHSSLSKAFAKHCHVIIVLLNPSNYLSFQFVIMNFSWVRLLLLYSNIEHEWAHISVVRNRVLWIYDLYILVFLRNHWILNSVIHVQRHAFSKQTNIGVDTLPHILYSPRIFRPSSPCPPTYDESLHLSAKAAILWNMDLGNLLSVFSSLNYEDGVFLFWVMGPDATTQLVKILVTDNRADTKEKVLWIWTLFNC